MSDSTRALSDNTSATSASNPIPGFTTPYHPPRHNIFQDTPQSPNRPSVEVPTTHSTTSSDREIYAPTMNSTFAGDPQAMVTLSSEIHRLMVFLRENAANQEVRENQNEVHRARDAAALLQSVGELKQSVGELTQSVGELTQSVGDLKDTTKRGLDDLKDVVKRGFEGMKDDMRSELRELKEMTGSSSSQ